MTITLPENLEAALKAMAERGGVDIALEAFAVELLRREVQRREKPSPVSEWERKLFSIGVECAAAPPSWAMSSDALYD